MIGGPCLGDPRDPQGPRLAAIGSLLESLGLVGSPVEGAPIDWYGEDSETDYSWAPVLHKPKDPSPPTTST